MVLMPPLSLPATLLTLGLRRNGSINIPIYALSPGDCQSPLRRCGCRSFPVWKSWRTSRPALHKPKVSVLLYTAGSYQPPLSLSKNGFTWSLSDRKSPFTQTDFCRMTTRQIARERGKARRGRAFPGGYRGYAILFTSNCRIFVISFVSSVRRTSLSTK